MKKGGISSIILCVMFIIVIVSIVLFIPHFRIFESSIKYDDQYLDGIVFSRIEYFNHKLKYCYHVLQNDNYKNEEILIYDNDIELKTVSFAKECNSFAIENEPTNVLFKNNDKESILSTKDLENNFYTCTKEENFPYQNNTNIKKEKESLDKYLNGKKTGIVYEDLNTHFSYKYNGSKIFYGASLIKLPEALYLIDEAISGNISLEETVKLERYYYNLGKDELKTNGVNSKVSVGSLIKYMLETSDNGAHLLLFDKYAENKIKKYEQSLGSPYTFQKGGDKFGNQTAEAMNVYLKHAYDLIVNNEEYGSKLKTYLVNDFYNNLKLDDGIDVAHKYGYLITPAYFHDVGIVFNDNPYTISVLTGYSKEYGTEFINNIHQKIKVLHELYYSEKGLYCLDKVYFNN